ncbi:MAG: winged helix-turn-helix transcriptional regulator [Mycolicibacterium sp.]|nr:winged helix-turn-helix transcriptional regulator [Mycolicibacterium sp.]
MTRPGATLANREASPDSASSPECFGRPHCDGSHVTPFCPCIVSLCNLGQVTRPDNTAALGADLLAVVARINRLANQRIELPLPFAQARLLSTIEDQGQTRISDLAALDHCSQPTMTTQVRRLEDAGLVQRAEDPGDARAVLIAITEEGRQILSRVRADRSAAINPYLEHLDDAERTALVDAIRVLRGLLDMAQQSPTDQH